MEADLIIKAPDGTTKTIKLINLSMSVSYSTQPLYHTTATPADISAPPPVVGQVSINANLSPENGILV